MNWVVLSLPLVISLAFLVASVVPVFVLREAVKGIRVPTPERRDTDITPVLQAFSKVFGGEEGELKTETAGTGDVVLIGTAVGSKRMALLRVGEKTLILEEGERKVGILLKGVSRRGAVIELDGREITVRIRRATPTQPGPIPGQTPTSEIRISKRDLERITRDPGIMFREIRLVPYVRDGKTEGFLFEWIKPGSLFHRAGLRVGDVLVSINNVAINSAEDAFRVLQVLRNEPTLRVVVLRNGQRKEISIRID